MTSLELHEQKSVLEHVGELRNKILIALVAFTVGAIVTHVFHEEVIAFFLKPAGDQTLVFLSPLEPLIFIFKIDAIGGLILSFPIIIWCLFSYISPALSRKVSNVVVFLYVTSTFLVFAGLLYAFFIMVPISLKFLFSIKIPGIENSFSVEKYLGFFITQTIIIMAVFQIPIIIIGGVYAKILNTKLFANKRRYIYLILLIALAIITPTTDLFSLSIMFVPCLVIFETSIFGGKIIEHLREKKKKTLPS